MSSAGRQLASDDERFLWPDVIDVIRTVRPDAVFLENVQNVVSVALTKGGPRGGVLALRLRDLRAAGYECRWTVLGACTVGAPHHRHRWYLVGRRLPAGTPVPEAVRIGTKAICGAPRTGGRFLLPTPMARDGDPTRSGEGDEAYWEARRANGRSNGMPLGAAVNLLPSPRASDNDRGAEPVRSARTGTGGTLLDAVQHLLPTPMAADGDRTSRVMPRGNLTLRGAADPERWGKYAEAVALWEQARP
jgi:DNA (cytosine-5)-methyltransferase 1